MTLVEIATAILIAASSLVVGVLFFARIQRRDFALLYYSLAAGIYSVRLFLQAAQINGGMADLVLTTLLPIPLVLLLVDVAAPEWRKAVRLIVALNLLSAVAAISARLLHAPARVPWNINNIVILLLMPFYIGMAFVPRRRRGREMRVLRFGLMVFLLFVIYTNLYWLNQFRFAPGSGSLEFIGFMFLLGSLGYVALVRTQRNEERFLALHRELEIARDIQTHLLPQAKSTVAGLVLGSRYLPASSVAGDFYDFLPKDGGLGILIADVSGHGVPAALSASMVKVAVRAQMDRADSPAEVLREMNTILCGNLQGQFVSAGYLFADAGQRALTYAGAGHPPLLVWRAELGRVESLEENGLLLGIFSGETYSSRSVPLEYGDRCLLYTDGLLEAPNGSGEEFGPERLSSFLAEHAFLPAQDFCDRLVDRVAEWQGGAREPHDDVTVVVVDFPLATIGSESLSGATAHRL